jgi:hypothetical protein
MLLAQNPGIAGRVEYFQPRRQADGALRQLEAVEATAEHDIGEQQMGFRLRAQESQRRLAAAGSYHEVAGRFEHRDGRIAQSRASTTRMQDGAFTTAYKPPPRRQTPGEGFGRSESVDELRHADVR